MLCHTKWLPKTCYGVYECKFLTMCYGVYECKFLAINLLLCIFLFKLVSVDPPPKNCAINFFRHITHLSKT
jgi:hypothetical protein